jgi:hypothetical protein
MAFLRFTRDKRGYEHFYLVQPSNRRGRSASRVLYWFRTPPNVRVGREPFDDAIRRALETQHPDVMFDWPKLVVAPLPAAEPERWRERRIADRAAKAGRADSGTDTDDAEGPEAAAEAVPPPTAAATTDVPPPTPPSSTQGSEGPQSPRRPRRRRRGRGSRPANDVMTSPGPDGARDLLPPDADGADVDRSKVAASRDAAERREVAEPLEPSESSGQTEPSDHAESRDRSDS